MASVRILFTLCAALAAPPALAAESPAAVVVEGISLPTHLDGFHARARDAIVRVIESGGGTALTVDNRLVATRSAPRSSPGVLPRCSRSSSTAVSNGACMICVFRSGWREMVWTRQHAKTAPGPSS